jgi:hypothetical protein
VAKSQPVGQVPSKALLPKLQVFEHAPSKSIAAAIKGSQQHVANVENAAGKK